MATDSQIGMTASQAKRVEYGIIGCCVLAMVLIFQPFSHMLFSVGCIGVVIGGLAFNLVPHCKAGTSRRALLRVAMVVGLIFVVVVALALASAWAYGIYLKSGA